MAVTDAQGRVVPIADNLVNFEISGAGKIIGVGNGDPSSHEPDVYLSYGNDKELVLNNWHMLGVPGLKDRAEVAESFSDADWDRVDVNTDSGPLRENTSAIFRAQLNLRGEDLNDSGIMLRFGMIDDDGWVYVNGQLVGESHDWKTSPAFDVGKFLHAGDNSIAVAVHNGDGPGGINKGVRLSIPSKSAPTRWQRTVFNGLAQVIVQAGAEPGEIRLTATSQQLAKGTVVINAEGHGPRPQPAQ